MVPREVHLERNVVKIGKCNQIVCADRLPNNYLVDVIKFTPVLIILDQGLKFQATRNGKVVCLDWRMIWDQRGKSFHRQDQWGGLAKRDRTDIIGIISFKVVPLKPHFIQHCFHWWEHSSNSVFRIASNCLVTFIWFDVLKSCWGSFTIGHGFMVIDINQWFITCYDHFHLHHHSQRRLAQLKPNLFWDDHSLHILLTSTAINNRTF